MTYMGQLVRDVLGRLRLPFMGRGEAGSGVGVFRFYLTDINADEDISPISEQVREEANFWGPFQADADRNNLDLLRRCVMTSSLYTACTWASCLTDQRVKFRSELNFNDCATCVIDNWTREPLMVRFRDQSIWLGSRSPLQTARDHIDHYRNSSYYDRFAQFTSCQVALLQGYQNATKIFFHNIPRCMTFIGYGTHFKMPTGRQNLRAAVLELVATVSDLYDAAHIQEGIPDYELAYSPTQVMVEAGNVVWHACRVLIAFGYDVWDPRYGFPTWRRGPGGGSEYPWFHSHPQRAERHVKSLIQQSRTQVMRLSKVLVLHYAQKQKYPTLRSSIPYGGERDYRRLSTMHGLPWELIEIMRVMAPYLGCTWGHMLEVNVAHM